MTVTVLAKIAVFVPEKAEEQGVYKRSRLRRRWVGAGRAPENANRTKGHRAVRLLQASTGPGRKCQSPAAHKCQVQAVA